MSIHILTLDSGIKDQFEQLLAGGQQPFHFYEDLEALISLVPKLKKTDKVFYDLQLEPSFMAFDALCFGGKKTNIVAFEALKEGADANSSSCPKNAKHYFVLSSDMRKASARLKQLLHDIDASTAKATAKRARGRAKPKQASGGNASTQTAVSKEIPVTLARYLTAKSPAMQELLVQIGDLAKNPHFVFLTGEDGADFELAAREINFRTNGEQSPLHIVDPMRVEIDQIQKAACPEDEVSYCFLGLSYELGALSVVRLKEYLDTLLETGKEAPCPCFILGHVNDSESYLEGEVLGLIKSFKEIGHTVQIPTMEERSEDVSLIAQSIFTTLRTAHPFLMTRTLSRDAISYLEEHCADLSYSGLVRVIRNSMALTERDTITADELKSFGDDNPTAQHLIESLADEKFFKAQNAAAEMA